MATSIELLIDDQGKLTVSVNPEADEAKEGDEGQEQTMPVSSLDQALTAIKQVAQQVISQAGQQPAEQQSQPQEAATPEPGEQEQAAMQKAYGK